MDLFPTFDSPEAPAFSAEACRLAAGKIAVGLAEKKRSVRDGSISWMRPDRSGAADLPLRLVAAGTGLYDGIPGIAIFLAAMAKLERAAQYRELAWLAIEPWRRLLVGIAEDPARARKIRFDIGGLDGLGSFVYSLVLLAELLEAPELLEDALRVSTLFTPELIAADQALDLVAGSGGAILTLLRLYRAVAPARRGQVLEIAVQCAEQILAKANPRPDGSLAWVTNPLYPELNGFVHGAAGLACALLQVDAATGGELFRQCAARAWQFERATYSPEARNWRDLTGLSPSGFLNQWCYGAPGIAMARLETLSIVDDPGVRQEIEAALATTASPELAYSDHWCCGEMGRIEVLLYAAEKLGDSRWLTVARERARRFLARREQRGRYHCIVEVDYPDPTLFSGYSGIGYSLLRLAHPGQLPCLLALE